MNDTAVGIAIGYGAVVVLGSIAAIVIARSTRSRRPTDPERLAERERAWLFVVVALLVTLLLGTIFFIPYGKSAPERGSQTVNVEARQFFWQLRPDSVRAHEPVEFRLRADDVNHGFGVYTSNDDFVFQVQVMPGKTQTAVHTFDRPGMYQILCLEFCGVGHHVMRATLRVTP